MSDKDPGQKIDKHFPDKKVVGTFPAANDMTVGDDTAGYRRGYRS